MAQEAAHIPLPGDNDQVHPCVVKVVSHSFFTVTEYCSSEHWQQSIVLQRNLPATRRMVPMMPHIGLVTAEGGTSFLPVKAAMGLKTY